MFLQGHLLSCSGFYVEKNQLLTRSLEICPIHKANVFIYFPPHMWFLVLSGLFLWKRLKEPPASSMTQRFSEEVIKTKSG